MTSTDTEGGPSRWRLFHFQYSRNPLRCQAMTVSGFTISNGDRQPLHNREPYPKESIRATHAADGHGWRVGGPRADVGGQESQLAALLEFERLGEQKKTARE